MNNLLSTGNDSRDWDSFAAKFDHRLTGKDSLAVRWLRAQRRQL